MCRVGSVVLGLVLCPGGAVCHRASHDIATAVIMQFVSTFAVWMLAERLHLSGIITMVVFAISVARRAPGSDPRETPDSLVCRLGSRRLRPERPGVPAHRSAAQADPRAAERRRVDQLHLGRGGGLRQRYRGASDLGHGVRPVAKFFARRTESVRPRPARCILRRGRRRDRLVRHARDRHAGCGAGSADRLSPPGSHPLQLVRGCARSRSWFRA